MSRINVIETFPAFEPGAGSYVMREPVVIQAVNQTLPALGDVARALRGSEDRGPRQLSAEEFREKHASSDHLDPTELRAHFDKHGSDKARNGYHDVYSALLPPAARWEPLQILEIGLGTNNSDTVSHMGEAGSPGASLRAFRDAVPGSAVFGADIDERILFEEERIRTFHVDQTNPSSLSRLAMQLPDKMDLVIDDGLHTPSANLTTLEFGIALLRPGGWIVIEDIPRRLTDLWFVVGTLLNAAGYETFLIHAGSGLLFAAKRCPDRY